MKNNSRLILKVKKKRSSISTEKLHKVTTTDQDKENRKHASIKRLNPFSTNNEKPNKVQVLTVCNHGAEEDTKTLLLRQLEAADKKSYGDCSTPLKLSSQLNYTFPEKESFLEERTDDCEIKYEDSKFPLDWSLKERVKFVSPYLFKPLKNNIKSANETKGIQSFVSNSNVISNFCENLYNWVHPNVPGLQTFPLRRKFTGSVLVEDHTLNLLSNNKPFQDLLMSEWRISFQSLFATLKTGYCPYFYLCSYQFTILFKSCFAGGNMVAVVTPTTKGFRKMLTDEGISFEYPHKKENADSTNLNEHAGHNESFDTSLNDSNNDDAFLHSIGLDKKSHFPCMAEHQRLAEKSKTRKFDNRLESTILIRNCQSFFNFLLNSSFLCSPSGSIIGIPPTLISPSPYQSGTLQRSKFTYGPIKYQKNGLCENQYCLEVSGTLLPTQVYGILKLLQSNDLREFVVQCKSYDNLVALNHHAEEGQFVPSDQIKDFGISESAGLYLHQEYCEIAANSEIRYRDGIFTMEE